MSELTLTLLRMLLLGLLWLFILAVLDVLRRDVYGTEISRRAQRKQAKSRARAALPAAGGPQPAAAQPTTGQATHTGAQPSPGQQPDSARGGFFGRKRSAPLSLAVTEGKLAGTTIPLRPSGVLIGRNPECALVLDDEYASGRHARIYAQGDKWFAEDLSSTNGTIIAGQRITAPTPVTTGTTVRIGTTVLEVRG